MSYLKFYLLLIWDVRRSIERGFSVRYGIETFQKREVPKNLGEVLNRQLSSKISANETLLAVASNPLLSELHLILEDGLMGESILPHLRTLEAEIVRCYEEEIERRATLLPLLGLVPVFFCILPSMLILILVPLFKSFSN